MIVQDERPLTPTYPPLVAHTSSPLAARIGEGRYTPYVGPHFDLRRDLFEAGGDVNPYQCWKPQAKWCPFGQGELCLRPQPASPSTGRRFPTSRQGGPEPGVGRTRGFDQTGTFSADLDIHLIIFICYMFFFQHIPTQLKMGATILELVEEK